jgi:hypothetical protein
MWRDSPLGEKCHRNQGFNPPLIGAEHQDLYLPLYFLACSLRFFDVSRLQWEQILLALLSNHYGD